MAEPLFGDGATSSLDFGLDPIASGKRVGGDYRPLYLYSASPLIAKVRFSCHPSDLQNAAVYGVFDRFVFSDQTPAYSGNSPWRISRPMRAGTGQQMPRTVGAPRVTENRARSETNIRPTTVARRTDSRNRYRNTQPAAVRALWDRVDRLVPFHRLILSGVSEQISVGAHHPPAT